MIIKLLRAAANRQHKNDAMLHAYADLADRVTRQADMP
jgi:hypothetical protein